MIDIKTMPHIVRYRAVSMSQLEQEMFLEAYEDQRKGIGTSYLASLLMLHYVYLGKPFITLLAWFFGFMTFGAVTLIWWIIDLLRIPGMVKKHNDKLATEIMRDYLFVGMGK